MALAGAGPLYRRALRAVLALPVRPQSERRALWNHVRATFYALRRPTPTTASANDANANADVERQRGELAPAVDRLTRFLELAARRGNSSGNRELMLLRTMAFVRFQQPLPLPPSRKARAGAEEQLKAFYADYDSLAAQASAALNLPLPQPYTRLPLVRAMQRPARPKRRARPRHGQGERG